MNFINLQRQFHDLKEGCELDDTERLVALSEYEFGDSFGWSKMLESKRVVLLAEAGSGKTQEMKQQAKRLVEDGEFGFFVPLDELDQESVVGILSPPEVQSFERWKANGQDTAWFFLDALDELKLVGGKLRRALNRLSRELSGLLDRARVIVSCRPSDWRYVVDLDTVKSMLSTPPRSSKALFHPSEEAFVQPLREDHEYPLTFTEDDGRATDGEGVRIVRMLPLNGKQIKLFAEASGVNDAESFLDAVNQEDALTFARRPLDLCDLITAWANSGCLGSRARQHEGNVEAKLKDHPDRPDRGVLPDSRARLGAERLALALALTRQRTIRSPEQAVGTEVTDGVLDGAGILIDWTEEERQTLLRRALFDPATYGRLRFHHRSIQEYLAACRLWRLREEGMTTKALFRLLFAERFGYSYMLVIPSMRPITAWLALWDDAVRQELIQREPETLISYGDPAAVPLSARKNLIRIFFAQYSQNKEFAPRFFADDVRRLSHPELGPVIRECWRAGPANHDVQGFLLQLIWLGPVRDCGDLAYLAARNAHWADGNRIAAIRALLACGCKEKVRDLANEMLTHPENWPAEIVFAVASDLFPEIIGAEGIATLIEKRSLVSGQAVRNFDWHLRQIVGSVDPKSEQAANLREKFVDLIWNGREEQQELHKIRSKYGCLSPALSILCERQLTVASGKPSEEMIRACVIASRFEDRGAVEGYQVRRLRKRFNTSSNWRDGAFWAELGLMDELIPSDDPRLRLRYAQVDSLLGSIDIADRPWLETALEDESWPTRRIVALYALIQIWRAEGQDLSELETIQSKLEGNASLERILTECTTPSERDEELERLQREWREEKRVSQDQEARRLDDAIKWRADMLADPADSFTTENRRATMHNICQWLTAAKRGRNRYGLWDKEALTEAFGPEVVDLAESAFRESWRNTVPVVWSARPADERGGTPYTWIYGLQGLMAEASTPGWTYALSSTEARTAAVYATIELNDFADFIADLTKSHPQEVEAVIGEEVSAELKVGGFHGHLSTLQNLAHADSELKQLVVPRLIVELVSWPEDFADDTAPKWASHLSLVLRILHSAREETDRQTVAQVCSSRFMDSPAAPLALDWLSGLFRFDAARGTEVLIRHVAGGDYSGSQEWATTAYSTLFGRDSTVNFEVIAPDQRAYLLGRLIRQAYEVIRPEQDETHEGVYAPNARDDAEMARNFLLNWLRDTPGAETCRVLLKLAEEEDFIQVSERLRSLARERAATDAEFPPFGVEDVLELESRYESPAHDRDGLFTVMMDRLEDIAHDLAHDDFSDRKTLWRIEHEPEMQRTLARRIREKANAVYEVTREEEVADQNRTDIRLLARNCGQKAVVELKMADRWTYKELEVALEEQLVTKYLRHSSCRAGCLLLVYRGKKNYWRPPETRNRLRFPELIGTLKETAQAIEAQSQYDVRITVFGIDLSDGNASTWQAHRQFNVQ